jgi:hypothetical protein
MKRPPRVADVVHYVDDDMNEQTYCKAAIITAIPDSYKTHAVDLVEFSFDDKVTPHARVVYCPNMAWGDWHYADECPLLESSEQKSEEITHEQK